MIGVFIALGLLAVCLIALLLRALAKGERTQLWTTRLRVHVPGLPDALSGWTLAFLSDLHVGRMYVPEERLLQALEEVDPDYLALAGDYAARPMHHDTALALLRRFAARWPTVCTLGNTEHYQEWDTDGLREGLEEAGASLLVNDSQQAELAGATVEFVGLDDPLHGSVDVEEAPQNAEQRPALRVAVVHSPAVWRELERLGAHILLCGHTHGGQVRIPGMEAFAVHTGVPRRLAAGLFRYHHEGERRPRMQRVASHWRILSRPLRPITASTANGPLMYVTRGVGATGPRARLFCPPELVAIEFLPDDEGDAEEAEEADSESAGERPRP